MSVRLARSTAAPTSSSTRPWAWRFTASPGSLAARRLQAGPAHPAAHRHASARRAGPDQPRRSARSLRGGVRHRRPRRGKMVCVFYAVIPAGGSGTRLWPLSRASHPKFLHALTGTAASLLQATVERLVPLADPQHTYVVTGVAHAASVARQLPTLPEE